MSVCVDYKLFVGNWRYRETWIDIYDWLGRFVSSLGWRATSGPLERAVIPWCLTNTTFKHRFDDFEVIVFQIINDPLVPQLLFIGGLSRAIYSTLARAELITKPLWLCLSNGTKYQNLNFC